MEILHLCAVSIAALFLLFPSESVATSKNASGEARLPQPATDAEYLDDGAPGDAKVRLGQQLFFDKILSGNYNISCATCHHPFAATSDGLSLPVGEGGRGVGVTRDTGDGGDAVHERVPRNSPALFNLGAREFTTLFHDGRIETHAAWPSGIKSPAGAELPSGLDSPLAAQAMFPVTSATEMAGQTGENPIADAVAIGDLAGPDGVWAQLAERIQGVRGYAEQFIAVFDDVRAADDIRFTHAANAIAAFESANWRADNSPFDRFLRGERQAMSASAVLGMRVFYAANKGNCASCHSGVFQTDHSFRAIAVPQIGPGKGDGDSGYEDFGRERVTGDPADRYKFRVPSLRNVAQSAPYGHSGAFNTLKSMVRHHLDPIASLYDYDPSQAAIPSRPDLDSQDYVAMSDPGVLEAIARANELMPTQLTAREIHQLIDFLYALTDPAMLDQRVDVPKSLPSGLPLRD
jgi:cytochrome c peroxidase